MTKGKSLSEYEKGKIDTFKDLGYSITFISNDLNRYRRVVSSYINMGILYGSNNSKRGRKLILSMRDKRKIANLTTNDKKSIREIQRGYFPDISNSTIFNVLSNNTYI